MGPEASLAFSLQALFERHEAYAADAETERARLHDEIARLEDVNNRLEQKNRDLLTENEELKTKLVDAGKDRLSAQDDSADRSRVHQMEARVEELLAEQGKLRDALNKALDQERIVVRDWVETKQELDELRRQLDVLNRKDDRHPEGLHTQSMNVVADEDDAEQAIGGRRYISTSSTTSTVEASIQDAMAKQQDVLLLLKEQVEDLRSQLLTHNNLDLVRAGVPTQDVTVDLSSNQQEMHVHHHYHTGAARPHFLSRANTQANRTRPSRSSRRRSKSDDLTNHAIEDSQDDPILEQALAVQSAFSALKSRASSNNSTPRPIRTISAFSASISSPESAHSTVFEHMSSEVDVEDSRPSTPSSSVIWTQAINQEEGGFCQDADDVCDSIPFDVSDPADYFSGSHQVEEASPEALAAPNTSTTFDNALKRQARAQFGEHDDNQQTAPSESIVVPRSRPLRSAASLALLRQNQSTESATPRPTARRLQSLPSTHSAPALTTSSITVTTVNAAATLSTTNKLTHLERKATSAAGEDTATNSKIGGWLNRWRSNATQNMPKTEHDVQHSDAVSKKQHISTTRSVSAPMPTKSTRLVSTTVAKLQAILDENEEKQIDDASKPTDAATTSEETAAQDAKHDPTKDKPRSDPSMLRDISFSSTVAPEKKPKPTPVRAPGVNQAGGLGLFIRSLSEHVDVPATPAPAPRPRFAYAITGNVDTEALKECLEIDEDVAQQAEVRSDAQAQEETSATDFTFFPRPRLDDDGVSVFSQPTSPPKASAEKTSTTPADDNAATPVTVKQVVKAKRSAKRTVASRSTSGGWYGISATLGR